MTRDVDVLRHRALAEPVRRQLLDELQATGTADVEQLARRVGLHPTTVRSHLERLHHAGLVDRSPLRSAGRGRPRFLYRPVPEPPEVETTASAMVATLAAALASTPDPAAAAREAGRSWGRQVAVDATDPPIARVTAALDRLGFVPCVGDDEDVIVLQGCPVVDAARSHRDVVCSVHLGMLESVAQAGTDRCAVALEPFATPRGCVVRLTDVTG